MSTASAGCSRFRRMGGRFRQTREPSQSAWMQAIARTDFSAVLRRSVSPQAALMVC